MLSLLRNYINGLAFGITETVPGVSAGTIAIILGYYSELIETINHFTRDIRKRLKFAIPFVLGIATGIVAFGSIIQYLLKHYSLPTMLFFIGLITGIIPIIFTKIKDPGRGVKGFKPGQIAQIAVPVLVLAVTSYLKADEAVEAAAVISAMNIPYMIFIFFAGIAAAAALIIPGISGSFVLLLIGVYPLVTYSLDSIRRWLGDMGNMELLLDICKVMIPLGVGIIIGGLSMARLIEKLLKNYYKTIYSIIFGLLIGSVYALFNDPIVYQSGVSMWMTVIGIVTFLLGGVLSFTLGKKRL
ncbi:MAG: DUF368 domain-containing protein [Oscillospiraceae bacterium]|jgi:putative membrane protein|nr:DUF368 domain-containing protein [Oscillospiraceae bacterium]